MPQEKYSCSYLLIGNIGRAALRQTASNYLLPFRWGISALQYYNRDCASLYSWTGRIPKKKTPPSCFSARTISHAKPQWLVPAVCGWPRPGKSTEKLQFASVSGPLGYAPTGIGCISFLPTFSSELGSDFKAGRKKSHHHKGTAIWTATFFFFVLIISQILQATQDQC